MKRLRRFLFVLIILALLLAGTLSPLHHYLAVTAPVDARVAVVEGWMPSERMDAVREEIERRHYSHIFTTGTLRPFSYYMRNGEHLVMQASDPVQGEVKINVSGIAHAGFILLAGTDTVLVQAVTGAPTTWHAYLPRPVHSLELLSTNSGMPPDDVDNIYVKRFQVGGVNMHGLVTELVRVHGDGSRSNGSPTHAHAAAAQLVARGIPASSITIAPALDVGASKTLANAAGFAAVAKRQGLDRFDVISLGVHARRSRKMYRKAMEGDAMVGVIAIPDPEVASDSWWEHRLGRYRMLKELAGVPMSTFFDAEE